ncbi:tetratricopeptide repeat protein [Fulvivirga lutea]|uniref:Tetratricopeptide repeat protein n=1 Tax=Fulvivirga lutea TaxID=2810512 RepID=A0A974WDN4_9BACT|nr:tetratricopeptide repeat protein [Fulvivirga lutea]QSE96194.1 hypothetical protein JR347_11280 [Fulvivirga lutea]
MAQAEQRRLPIIRHYIFIASILLPSLCFSQTQEEKIRDAELQAEQMRKVKITKLMDEGIDFMENEQYEEANDKFKEVLATARVIPTDLTFFFGKNSFHLGKYEQSIDWLNKYIELKGTTGQYYQECVNLLDQSNKAFLIVKEQERKEAKQILASNYQIDCGPSGKVVCPVCSGNGVIIQRGAFGDIYKTCPYSDEHGYLTCDEYNLLMRGELKPKF